MLRRECRNLRGVAKGQRIAKRKYCICVLGCGRGKGDVEFLDRGRFYYRQSHAKFLGGPGQLLGYYQPDVGQMQPPISRPPYMNDDDHRTTAGNKHAEQPFVRSVLTRHQDPK
jgi:hypothetical protein